MDQHSGKVLSTETTFEFQLVRKLMLSDKYKQMRQSAFMKFLASPGTLRDTFPNLALLAEIGLMLPVSTAGNYLLRQTFFDKYNCFIYN